MNQQNTILVRTKLNAPTINHKIIKREKVRKKLQKFTNYKLTLITAPAGSGKTTSAVGYLAEAGIPFAWLSLDESDNEPVRFWRYMLAAFRGLGDFGENFWEIPASLELIRSNILADMVLDKLYTLPGETVMVLDDYHLIDNEIIQSGLAYFIKYLPSHFRMMILSRKEPNLKVMREWASGQVCRLNVRDLSFNHREVAEFFRDKGYLLTTEEISLIWDYTEGWAAGLVFMAISMEEEGGDIHETIKRFSAKNRHINQLFQDEVFDRWPDKTKEFLVRIAFLDKFCGPLCEAVTDLRDSAEYLKKLAEGNSFIFHLDQSDEWFRFHHLFRDFLRRKLAGEELAVRRELCSKAGEWYQENGYLPEAIETFIEAGEYGPTLKLLNKIIHVMGPAGEYSAWLKWMGAIPLEYYEGEVRACTGNSWALSMENRTHEAKLWADRAQSCFDRIKDGLAAEEKDFLETNVIAAKANLAVLEMDIDRAIDYFHQTDRLKLQQYLVIGEMNSGKASLLKTAYCFGGRLKKVNLFYSLLVDKCHRLFGLNAVYVKIILAECAYERNNLDIASELLLQGMEDVIELKNPGAIVPCMIILARIKRAAGDMEGALWTIDMGRRKLSGRGKTFWNYFLDVFTAGIYIDRHDASAAAEWLNLDRLGVLDDLSGTREYEYLTFTRYLNLIGRYDDALLLLGRLENFAKKEDRLGSRIEILCQKAITYQLKGESVHAMTALDKALDLGMEDGYVRTFLDYPEPMAELLDKYRNWKKKAGAGARYSYAKDLFRLVQENIRIIGANRPADEEVPSEQDPAPQLSVREYRVLRLLAAKRSNSEIAAEFCLSVRTVKYYNSQIFEKLGVENRTEAVARAWETGILE